MERETERERERRKKGKERKQKRAIKSMNASIKNHVLLKTWGEGHAQKELGVLFHMYKALMPMNENSNKA
jgi:hypothetical protein